VSKNFCREGEYSASMWSANEAVTETGTQILPNKPLLKIISLGDRKLHTDNTDMSDTKVKTIVRT